MRIGRGNVLVSENPQTKKDSTIMTCSGLAASIRYAHPRHGVVACSMPPALAARLRFGLQQGMFRKRKRMKNQHIGRVQAIGLRSKLMSTRPGAFDVVQSFCGR
jgi:hypothetical protein